MGSRTLSTYLQKDLDQIAAPPDGDLVFIDLIGFEVPSFVDPRYDLVQPGQVAKRPRLNHHVPLAYRGPFRPEDLPERSLWTGETNEEGLCVCTGKKKDGLPCRAEAQNRSQFCGMHGGALHPADKKMTKLPSGILPDIAQARKLTRSQKVMMEIIPVEELGDDEIQGLFVYDDDGRKVKSRKLTEKIHAAMVKEMMTRSQDFMQTALPSMLNVIKGVAEDPLNEAGDRLKAAVWMAERSIGKTPDVVIHGKTDAPYEQIFTSLETTSRDDYRRSLESGNIIEGEVVPDGDSRQSGVTDDGARDDESGDYRSSLQSEDYTYSRSDLDEQGSDESDGNDDSDEDELDPAQRRARDIAERRLQLKRQRERRDQMQKAKNRRFAARMSGMLQVDDVPWMIEWKPTGKQGYFCAKLWPPDAITPDIADRIATAEAITDNGNVLA